MKLQLQNTAHTLLFSLITLLLVACGGGSSNSTPSGAPVTEDSRAASAILGGGGGSVTATASNGVIYTLDIPAGALSSATEIRLTPISDMGDAPLAEQTFGAVQFEPSGLTFKTPATLHIGALPTLAGGRKLVGFSTANNGENFRLNLARVDVNSTLVSITHFSTGGATEATEAELIPLEDLTAPLNDAEDAIAQLSALTARDAGLVQIVDVFRQWYVEIVKPALDKADGANDIVFEVEAMTAYSFWIDGMDFVSDRASLDIALAAELNEAAPMATRIFTVAINRVLDDSCITSLSLEARLAALSLASDFQSLAQRRGLAASGSGLDRATFLLLANNCVRPVLDPITLPTPLTIGTGKSIDAHAQIIYTGVTDPQAAPFAFTLTAVTGASVASPDGFSDADGNYTSVFTPSGGTVEITVRACLVLPDGSVTGVTSDICVSQTAYSMDIFSGTLSVSSKVEETSTLFNGEQYLETKKIDLSAFVSMGVFPDGRVKILSVSGSSLSVYKAPDVCTNADGSQVELENTVVDSIAYDSGDYRVANVTSGISSDDNLSIFGFKSSSEDEAGVSGGVCVLEHHDYGITSTSRNEHYFSVEPHRDSEGKITEFALSFYWDEPDVNVFIPAGLLLKESQ